jgi:branched-chain amino acid transport system ATP-binding protein
MPTLLEIRGLTRRFGGLTAVDAIDLDVAEGELVSVIGPNGAGKTTLFNLVTGLDVPDSGTVRVAGVDLTGGSAEQAAAHGLARTFQHGRVFANLSVLDNVLVGAHSRLAAVKPDVPRWAAPAGALAELALALWRPRAVRDEEAALRAEAREILALFGERLVPRLDHPAHSLSYANRRRLEIARALALKPRLLLLDEPTAGMNESETAEMLEIIRGLKARGQTILLIEHKLELVMQLSDRVLVMDDGRRIAHGVPGAVRHDPAVIEAYLGHRHVGADTAAANAARSADAIAA